jgi:hypothetical protein
MAKAFGASGLLKNSSLFLGSTVIFRAGYRRAMSSRFVTGATAWSNAAAGSLQGSWGWVLGSLLLEAVLRRFGAGDTRVLSQLSIFVRTAVYVTSA